MNKYLASLALWLIVFFPLYFMVDFFGQKLGFKSEDFHQLFGLFDYGLVVGIFFAFVMDICDHIAKDIVKQ